MSTQIAAYMKKSDRSKEVGRRSGRWLTRPAACLLLIVMLTCAGWLAPGKVSAATDDYYLQKVASSDVCIGTATTNQTAAANVSPTGATVTFKLPTGFSYYHASWTAATTASSLADDMYTAPYSADMTISSLYLHIENSKGSTNSPDQFVYAKFYDMDSAAPCPGFEQGVLIGQTAPINWTSNLPTSYQYHLKLEDIFYNIQAGHRIRIELWTLLEHYIVDQYVTIFYGSGKNSKLTAFQTPTTAEINTVGPGTALAAVTIAPGSPATDLDTFTLQTTADVDTVHGVTVTLTPAGSARGIKEIQITSDDGAIVYGTLVNPLATATVFDIPLTTDIIATTTEVPYKIRILPQTHAGMPASPGAVFAVQGHVTHLASLYNKVYNDTLDTTVTIDNGSPANPSWGTPSSSDSKNTLTWTNPADPDFSDILLLRGTTSVTATPVEGATYLAGATLGSSTIIAAGNLQTFTDTGLTNNTSYYYRLFARDQNGNYSTGISAGPIVPGTNTCLVGNGVNPANVIIGIGDTNWTDLDTFTLQSSPPTSVTSVTITLPPGTADYLSDIRLLSSGGTSYRQISNPTGDTVTFSGLAIPITSSVSSYKVQIRPKQSTPPPVGTEALLTGIITAITLDNPSITVTYNDTASATVTIDHKAPANPVLQYATPVDSRVNFRWTSPADSDLYGILILRNTVPVTETLQDGTPYYLYSYIGTSIVMYGSSNSPSSVVTWGDTSTVNGTPYYYKIFSRDPRGNYSSGLSVGPVTPLLTVTVGNGTNPANSVITPGSGAASLDAFTLIGSSNRWISSVTVTLSAGAQNVVGTVRVASGDGLTVYGSVANPVSELVTIPTTDLRVDLSSTEYRIEILPKMHANMPAVPGAEVEVTGHVTEITTTTPPTSYSVNYGDTTSATLTVDNLSPANPAGITAFPLDSGINVSWANPPNADFDSVLVLRNTVAVADLPVEGVSYTAGMTIGTSSVAYVGNLQTFVERGLTDGTDYHYRLFARDSRGNYSAVGSPVGPLAPLLSNRTVADNATAVSLGLDRIAVTMPYTDDANGNGTCAIEYKFSSSSSWLPWTTGVTRAAGNCTTTITALQIGTPYDVRMTHNDSDGVLGTASQTVTGIVALVSLQTSAGKVTGVFDTNRAAPTTMIVTAPFTYDYNHNNSCLLEYRQDYTGEWLPLDPPYLAAEGEYQGFVPGVQRGVHYDVRLTFVDPDGVNGQAVQTISGVFFPTLMHNSLNANTKNYWGGSWGIPGGMYGEFTCLTCHTSETTNASRIRTEIMGRPVRYTGSDSMGDDSVPKPDWQTGTYKVCEVCHTQTYGRIGWEENPPGSGTWVEIEGPIHRNTTSEPSDHAMSNGRDCTECHPHDKGFGVYMGP